MDPATMVAVSTVVTALLKSGVEWATIRKATQEAGMEVPAEVWAMVLAKIDSNQAWIDHEIARRQALAARATT